MHFRENAGKFLTESADHACKQLHLTVTQIVYDTVIDSGKKKELRKAMIMRDGQKRGYYFVCKRDFHFLKGGLEVSIDENILLESFDRNCLTLLLVACPDSEGNPRNYIYTLNPTQIFTDSTTWYNEFNRQRMCNFNAKYLVNTELTRMKSPVEIRIEDHAEEEKNMITRWTR